MEPSLEALQERIDRGLAQFLGAERQRILDLASPQALPLLDEIERILQAGGKRLRPVFCYWGHRAAGSGEHPSLLRAAAALELLHTFAIVHDDVMDATRRRRGQPTSHVRLAGEVESADAGQFGIAAAILVGDYALTLAVQLLEESGFPLRRLRRANRWIHEMRTEVIAGQYLDLLACHRWDTDEQAALHIAALKSGGYTVQKPLLFGAALARCREPRLLDALARYGHCLGVAFQLRDDVLSIFGRAETTGKDVDCDLLGGKRTYLMARAFAAASAAERRTLERCLGRRTLRPEETARARGILRQTGALAATLAKITELTGEALSALEPAEMPLEVSWALRELAAFVEYRER